MKRMAAWLACAWIGLASAAGGSAPAETLPDLLDMPALHSSLAASRLLNDVARAGRRLVAVGQRGIVLYSDDAGGHWQQARVPVSVDLVAVHFADSRHGWAVGHAGTILSSDDGGASWKRQFDGRRFGEVLGAYAARLQRDGAGARELAGIRQSAIDGAAQAFLDVWFKDEREGYAVGSFNLIFHTGDGGLHWLPLLAQTDNPQLLHLYAVHGCGEDVYVAGEQGLLLKLDRGSGRFAASKTPYHGTFFGVLCASGAVLAYGLRGHVLRSDDGGASWEAVELGSEAGVTGAGIDGEGRVLLVDLAGEVFRSSGQSGRFAKLAVAAGFPYAGVADAGAGKLALVGVRGVSMRELP